MTRPHRYLNPDGTSGLHRVGGVRRSWFGDWGHRLLTMQWPWFVLVVMIGYGLVNLGFALLYMSCGSCIDNARPGSFTDSFFFSVQTLATIGYGYMIPKGVVANGLVAVEALVGMMFLAVVASLAYARFTRPTAGVMFSDRVVVGQFDGKPALMLRIANQRSNQIVQASASLSMVRDEPTVDGRPFRRIHDLKLVRSVSPLFTMSWTVVHLIDQHSPLFGATADSLSANSTEFLVLFTGHHEGFGQRVHSRRAYAWWELAWNARFVDMIVTLPDGKRALDLHRFNHLENQEI